MYLIRSIPTHFRIDTFQFQSESWLLKTTFFMFVCPKNRYQTGWKDNKLKQNIPNSGAYPFKGTFFRSISVHPIFGGQKISFFRSMSVQFWKIVVLLSVLSGANPFTDWPFHFPEHIRSLECSIVPLQLKITPLINRKIA